MYCKIENNVVVYPPVNDGNSFNVDKNETWLIEHGYSDKSEEEIAQLITPVVVPVSTVKRYSKYKLKLELQKYDLWDTFKENLTEDEYETFLLVQELASDDENFQTILDKFRNIYNYEMILTASEIEDK